MPAPIQPAITTDSPAGSGCEKGLVRLSDAVRAMDADLGKRVRALEIRLEAEKNRHCFCPDCRDKMHEEECLRCQVQRLTRRLRKYEPNVKGEPRHSQNPENGRRNDEQ